MDPCDKIHIIHPKNTYSHSLIPVLFLYENIFSTSIANSYFRNCSLLQFIKP